ncbi:Parvulin-like PPIase [Rhodovastum atsumiense]|uniref:Parvulin-like PPIase n=1 Tax=Rhodovastum atsumiense TaxID=504468 RepID=A0A5M6IR44_9PROT|nr:peptidylprolyl isomerase [Rhodovastum atsumiense]KAA5610752.1 peptidylprolyl isomerase [Rhodovastum atsumiense]CAH2604398.1 Parvulin-like PPIase [Rhodovastum atsumiense]
MRHLSRTAPILALTAFCAVAAPVSGRAQAPAPSAPPAAADPVVARVDSTDIRLSDVQGAIQSLPPEYRAMPPQMLYPALVDQLVDRKAVALLATRQGLDKDPQVQRQMARAAEEALQSALFHREIGPQVSDAAVRARYDHDIAGKTGAPEVHARHILVASEADAKAIIAELKKGGDFAAIAKARSTDPGAAQGGDLGWFKQGDMLPEFSEAAFALKPGQVSDKPVQTRYGWHVIKVEERRTAPTPTFEQARDDLRNTMVQEAAQKLLTTARAGVKVEKFNLDGMMPRATDGAEPPPAPAK